MSTSTSAVSVVYDQASPVGVIAENEVQMIDPRKLVFYSEMSKHAASEMVDQMLLDSIIARGFEMDRPLMGAWTEVSEGVQEMRIVDGARRVRAVLAAIEKGVDIKKVPVLVAPKVFRAPV